MFAIECWCSMFGVDVRCSVFSVRYSGFRVGVGVSCSVFSIGVGVRSWRSVFSVSVPNTEHRTPNTERNTKTNWISTLEK